MGNGCISSKKATKPHHRTVSIVNSSSSVLLESHKEAPKFENSLENLVRPSASRPELIHNPSLASDASTIKQCQAEHLYANAASADDGGNMEDKELVGGQNPFGVNENSYPPLKHTFTPLFNSNVSSVRSDITPTFAPLDRGGISKQMTFGVQASSFRNLNAIPEEHKNIGPSAKRISGKNSSKQSIIPEASEKLEGNAGGRKAKEGPTRDTRPEAKPERHSGDSTATEEHKPKRTAVSRRVEDLDTAGRKTVFKNLLSATGFAKASADSAAHRGSGTALSTRMEDLEKNFVGSNGGLKEKREDATISQLSMIRPKDTSSLLINNLGNVLLAVDLSIIKFNDTDKDTPTPKTTHLVNSENDERNKRDEEKFLFDPFPSASRSAARFVVAETIGM